MTLKTKPTPRVTPKGREDHAIDAGLAERLFGLDPLVGGMGATPNMGFAPAARPRTDDKE